MPSIRKVIILLLPLFLIMISGGSKQSRNEVDVVFCIDMSGSTNGLIPDFSNRLWEIANGIYKLRPYPRVRIAVIGFSRPSFGRNNGYVKLLSDFTEDYEKVTSDLQMLKPSIEKGDQFVGAALEKAAALGWSSSPAALRVIYLMGNGTVSAGGYSWRNTCEELLHRNIFVNSIYCVQQKVIAKELPGWKTISDNTGGEFFTYKISSVSPSFTLPQYLQPLVNINSQLNSTYIYHGINGKQKMNSMLEADKQSMQMGPAYFLSRLQYKTSDPCQAAQSGWDLVNYVRSSGLNLKHLDHNHLPDSIRDLDEDSLIKLILARKDERNFLVNQAKKLLEAAGQDTLQPEPGQLGGIIVQSVNKLARDKGFFKP